MKESTIQCHVADYLRLRYPKVLFHSDYGSGIKLTPGQAMKQKRQKGGRRAWPDIFIAEPRTITMNGDKYQFNGLFIELKRDGTHILKKDGSLVANEHIREQHELLHELQRRGYMAYFAVGFEQAKQIIDMYLGGGMNEEQRKRFEQEEAEDAPFRKHIVNGFDDEPSEARGVSDDF